MSSDGDYYVVTVLCLQTDLGVKASALKKHCESEEKFGVNLNDFSCATLKCREAHMSYIDFLSERRPCVIPDVVLSRFVDVYVSLAGTN